MTGVCGGVLSNQSRPRSKDFGLESGVGITVKGWLLVTFLLSRSHLLKTLQPSKHHYILGVKRSKPEPAESAPHSSHSITLMNWGRLYLILVFYILAW